jgi:hypothetical protein
VTNRNYVEEMIQEMTVGGDVRGAGSAEYESARRSQIARFDGVRPRVVERRAVASFTAMTRSANAHNHGGRFVLGVDAVSKSRTSHSDAVEAEIAGRLRGSSGASDERVRKQRERRPANPNARL